MLDKQQLQNTSNNDDRNGIMNTLTETIDNLSPLVSQFVKFMHFTKYFKVAGFASLITIKLFHTLQH